MPVITRLMLAVCGFLFLSNCAPAFLLRHDPRRFVHGSTAPEFAEVREAFIENFAKHREIGAACAVYYRGRKVVDIWGGYGNIRTRRAWDENTIVPVFSTTKGVSALALALLHARGLLDYDQQVALYWPEFARNGKGSITVRQLLGHQAGLCAIDTTLTLDCIRDLDTLAPILARQRPRVSP